MTLPLAGVLILDLADEPLALAGRLLADLGADVVRVEDAAGDDRILGEKDHGQRQSRHGEQIKTSSHNSIPLSLDCNNSERAQRGARASSA